MKKLTDCFNWDTYTAIYSKQVNEQINNDKTTFLIENSVVENGEIIFKDSLHPNWKEIYNEIISRKVNSVFECGCGPGHHLHNLKKLNPKLDINGCDLLETQINFGRDVLKVNKEITNKIKIIDLSALCNINEKYEFVYTQAVVMHLNHNKALNFIKNMAKLSSKYIYLIENTSNHNFPQLINESGILDEFMFTTPKCKFTTGIMLIKS